MDAASISDGMGGVENVMERARGRVVEEVGITIGDIEDEEEWATDTEDALSGVSFKPSGWRPRAAGAEAVGPRREEEEKDGDMAERGNDPPDEAETELV